MRRLLEGGVYKRAAFNSKIKIEESEIMCQFRTTRHFVNHAVLYYKLKMLNMAFLAILPITPLFSSEFSN